MKTLKDVYQKYWDGYIAHIRNNHSIEPANPFLLVEPSGYRDKTEKVMICGQETQGWGNEFDCPDKATMDAILRIYAGFVNEGGKISAKSIWRSGGPAALLLVPQNLTNLS